MCKTEIRILLVPMTFLFAVMVFFPGFAWGEQAEGETTAVEERINTQMEAAQQRIEQLEGQLEELSGQIRTITEGADQGADQLREQISQQEARIAELEQAEQSEQGEEEQSEGPERLSWSTGTGLVFRPLNNDSVVLGLRGFLWARYDFRRDNLRSDGGTNYTNNFSIPETRLRFMATFADGLFHLAIQPNIAGGRPGLQDGYLELRLHPAATIRFGQQLVPFDWESNTSPPRLPLNSLGPLAGEFGHARDLGIMVMGTVVDRLHYRLGVFNGAGRNTSNDNDHLLVAAMLRVQILGSVNGGWGWSDIGRSERPNLAFRAGFTWDRDPDEILVDEENEISLPFTMAAYQATSDLLFRWYGASVAAVVYYRGAIPDYSQEILDHGNEESTVHSLGYLIHGGFFVWPEKLELLCRFTWLDQDIETDNDEGFQVDAGFTFFLIGHHARITALYKYTHDLPRTPDVESSHALQIEARGWF